jgi:two-component system, NtrC family, sensor kinase
MGQPRILVVDDEDVICELFTRALGQRAYAVETVSDVSRAMDMVRVGNFNIVVTDLKMPGMTGMDVLKNIKTINPFIEVIIITGYATVQLAVEAIKEGAFDFICKPFEIEQMDILISRCLEKQKATINAIEVSELTALFEIIQSMTVHSSLEALLQNIFNASMTVTKAQKGYCVFFHAQSGKVAMQLSSGMDVADITADVCAGPVMQSRDPSHTMPELCAFPVPTRRVEESGSEENRMLSIPLVSRHPFGFGFDILGRLCVGEKKRGDFTDRDKTMLSILAGQAVVAIENFRLYAQIQEKIKTLEKTIAELHETQNKLIQSEKMAAVGQLAFGIAHEIRNPLGIVLGGVDFLSSRIQGQDQLTAEAVQKIKQAIDRANTIIINLLKFSRTSQLKKTRVDVGALLDDVVALVTNQASMANVKITRLYAEKKATVFLDQSLMRQVFFNVCMNAIDAMAQGGILTLDMQAGKDTVSGRAEITVEISDTGTGIPAAVQSKIFDPFFTTKEPGKGTGLGLSIVGIILERHGGSIRLESTEGKGTIFYITLPSDMEAPRGIL